MKRDPSDFDAEVASHIAFETDRLIVILADRSPMSVDAAVATVYEATCRTHGEARQPPGECSREQSVIGIEERQLLGGGRGRRTTDWGK